MILPPHDAAPFQQALNLRKRAPPGNRRSGSGWGTMQKYLLPILRRIFERKPLKLLSFLSFGRFPIRKVIHVGAHLGQERRRYRKMGVREVLWIEGSPSIHAQLLASLDADRAAGKLAGRHVAVNALLTDKSGANVVLHGFSNAGASNSIFPMTEKLRETWPSVRQTGEDETVVSSTLDEIAAREGFENPDLVVVDVQGAELLVLRGGTRTLASAKAVVSEVSTVPYYEGGVLFGELNAFLETQDFAAAEAPSAHGDILYLRKELL
jgi:FkbM family methyltransferase